MRGVDARAPSRPALAIGNAGSLPRSPTVLLLVDVINPLRFPTAQALAAPALRAARATATLKRRMRRAGACAIYANDNYGVWRSDFRQLLEHCRALDGAAGAIARLLAPADDDIALLKPRHSAFYATPLELLLTQMKAERLVIVGLAADLCVQMSAMDARMRGYPVWTPADCTAAESPARKRDALRFLRRALGCEVRSAARAR